MFNIRVFGVFLAILGCFVLGVFLSFEYSLQDNLRLPTSFNLSYLPSELPKFQLPNFLSK